MDFTQLTMVWSWVIDTWGIPSSFNDEAIFCWTWTYQGYMIETCFFGDFAILAIVFCETVQISVLKCGHWKACRGGFYRCKNRPQRIATDYCIVITTKIWHQIYELICPYHSELNHGKSVQDKARLSSKAKINFFRPSKSAMLLKVCIY